MSEIETAAEATESSYPVTNREEALKLLRSGIRPYDGATIEGKRACLVFFGFCSLTKERSFGPPDADTPHVCDGAFHHASKLHRCALCGTIGARVEPTKYTSAGREYMRLTRARQQEIAAQKHTAMKGVLEAEMPEVG